ncbi:MAG: hypothetical protein AAGJ18_05335, partial [Bacteroidota bacterium]
MLVLIGICLCQMMLFAQNKVSEEIEISFKNWDHLHQSGDYQMAAEQAQKAFEFAERSSDKMLMANALYKEGLSLLKITKRLNRHRKLAKAQLEKALFYLASIDDPTLKVNILEQLLWIAKKEKDNEQAAIYQNQIIEIKALVEASKKNEQLIEKKSNLENRVTDLAVQKKALTERVKSLSEAQLES